MINSINELLTAVTPFLNTVQEALPQAEATASLEAVTPSFTEVMSRAEPSNQGVPVPQPVAAPGPSAQDPSDEAGPSHQGSVVNNTSLESSMRTRIVQLERDNSDFLLGKDQGAYWKEVKLGLDQAPSQEEYARLITFENRDLLIRESKHECYKRFEEVLSQHPELAENAAYSPTESFGDFFNEARDMRLGIPADIDHHEIQFVDHVAHDLITRGKNSVYIKKLLGNED